MKAFVLSLLVILIVAMPISVSADMGVVLGIRHDGGLRGAYGLVRSVGGPMWASSTIDYGANETFWHNEVMAIFKVPGVSNLYAGIVAGPSARWLGTNTEPSLITYLEGTAGFVVNYKINELVAVGGYAKWVSPLEDNLQKTKYLGGVALILKL